MNKLTNVVMSVDFRFIHFKGDSLFMIWILANIKVRPSENPHWTRT